MSTAHEPAARERRVEAAPIGFPPLFLKEDERPLVDGVWLRRLDRSRLEGAQALVRRLFPGDDASGELERSLSRVPYRDGATGDLILASEHWVAVDERAGKVIGIAGLSWLARDHEEAVWGSWLGIDPDCSEQGLGFYLGVATLRTAFGSGRRRLRAYTEDHPGDGLAALFYEVAGFEQVRSEELPRGQGRRVWHELDLALHPVCEPHSGSNPFAGPVDARDLGDGLRLVALDEGLLASAQDLVHRAFPGEGAPLELECAVRGVPFQDAVIGDEILRAGHWVVCETRSRQVVGIGGLALARRDWRDTLWGSWFCVDPAVRGSGLGFLLALTMYRKAHESGRRRLMLYTDTADAAAQQAIRFYEASGFRRVARGDRPGTGSELWYELLLPAARRPVTLESERVHARS